jgi:hypothetical protein
VLPIGDALSRAAASPALNGEGWRQATDLGFAIDDVSTLARDVNAVDE